MRSHSDQENPFGTTLKTRKVKTANKSYSVKSVKQLVGQIESYSVSKPRNYSQQKKEPQLDREQIRKQMKQKWRDPGYVNVEFSHNKALKGKLLNEWEMSRIFLAKRSYQKPKGFKGFKNCDQSREFPKVPMNVYSEKFQKHLHQVEEQSENLLFDSTKMKTEGIAKLSSYRDKMKNTRKQFQKYSMTGKQFGIGTVLWKAGNRSEAGRKIRTIQC